MERQLFLLLRHDGELHTGHVGLYSSEEKAKAAGLTYDATYQHPEFPDWDSQWSLITIDVTSDDDRLWLIWYANTDGFTGYGLHVGTRDEVLARSGTGDRQWHTHEDGQSLWCFRSEDPDFDFGGWVLQPLEVDAPVEDTSRKIAAPWQQSTIITFTLPAGSKV